MLKDIITGSFLIAWLLLAACSSSRMPAGNTSPQTGTTGSFMGVGNEPSWSVRLEDGNFLFTSLTEYPEINAPLPPPQKAQDANVSRYRAVTEKAEVIIQVSRRECIDDMSGQSSPFVVTVDIKRTGDNDYKTFAGCGRYRGETRLHDIWALKELNGRTFDVRGSNRHPAIELHVAEGRVMGNNGCSEFSGEFYTQKNAINFSALREVGNSCDSSLGKEFLNALTDANRYELKDLHLLLYRDNTLLCNF